MIDVNEKNVRKILEEIAPEIESLTGWDAYLDSLDVHVIKRKEYKDFFQKKYTSLGINIQPKNIKEKLKFFSDCDLYSIIITGEYFPAIGNGTLLIIPDNFKPENKDGLVSTLTHELAHRAQFANNPKFFQQYIDMGKRYHTGGYSNGNKDKNSKKLRQSYMTFVEGDTCFIQEQLKPLLFPNPKVHYPVSTNLTAIALLVGDIVFNKGNGLYEQMQRYTRGEKIIKNLYNLHRDRKGVNEIYKNFEDFSYLFE